MSARLLRERLGSLPVSRVVERGFTIFAIYVLSGGWLWQPASLIPTDARESSWEIAYPVYFGAALAIYCISFILVFTFPRALWRAVTADLLLVALLALTLASMLWSEAPVVVFRRWIALLGTTTFGIYLHLRYDTEMKLRLLGLGLGIGAVFSLVFFSREAIAAGEFNGIYENKNSLGRMMALSTIVFVFLGLLRPRRATAIVFGGLSVLLLLMARSSTALVVVLTIVCLIPMFRMLGRDVRLTVSVGSVAILVAGIGLLLAAANLESVTSLVGRDVTLTGRTDLWKYVVEMIWRRPWLGYGYETFWLWELPWRVAVDEGAGWTAPNAHNGYLEVTLSLGLTGLLLFLFGLGRGLGRALIHFRRDATPRGLWPLVYLSYVVLYNVTEIAVLTQHNLVWVLYVSALLAVAPERDRAQRQPTPPPPGLWPGQRSSDGPAVLTRVNQARRMAGSSGSTLAATRGLTAR